MPQPNYGLDPYADEAAEIERKRRYADALRAQSGEPITPYSVGGQQGPISWTQGAAKLLQGYNAGAARKQAEEQAKALRERVQGDRSADMGAFAAALRGREAIPAPPDALGGGPAAPAIPPDPNAIQSLEFKSPMFQQAQLQQMIAQMKPKPLMNVAPGGVVLDPNTGRPIYTAPQKPDKPPAVPSAIQEYEYAQKQGFKGSFQDFQIAQRKAGATRVGGPTILVGKGDEKYVEERRKAQATRFGELEKAAESAYRQIGTLDRFIEASKKGTAGGAQPIMSAAQNFLASFGYPAGSLKDVRVMEQAIGDILGNKMSELGARGLTDKDMEILRQALPRVDIDAKSRVAVAGILKKSAQATLNEYGNARAEEARIYPEFAQKTPEQAWFKDWKKRAGADPTNIPDEPPPGAVRPRQ